MADERPKRKGRTWTEEQKAEQSKVMQRHWQTHEHPRQGVATPTERRAHLREVMLNREVKSRCRACGQGLSDDQAVADGYGKDCRERGLEEGWLQLGENGRVEEVPGASYVPPDPIRPYIGE